MTTVRTILAIAASQSWHLYQMDVKNVFLHGDLQKDIYMKFPSGMTTSPQDVCKLRRPLYGLKQAPRAWFDKFCSTLLIQRFTQSQYDSSFFFHKSASGIILLLVYMDDIILTGTDSGLITRLHQLLHATFHMKDLGQLAYFLGLEVYHRPKGIFLNQHKYTQDIITLAGLADTSSIATPMEVNVKYRKDEEDLLDDPTLYRRLVGSLIYFTTIRPDISYVVHQVSQFMSCPRHLHLAAVRRIIHYLQGSPTRGLFFAIGSSLQLVAYSDGDWVGCPDTCRSTTGWYMFLGDALISWKCKIQDRVSKSSNEAEYRAMSIACSKIMWLRGLLEELEFPQTNSTPLHVDNTNAIQIATDPIFHELTRHIVVDFHSIHNTLERRVISLPYISSDLQVVDVFTKAMTQHHYNFLVGKLLLVDLPTSI
ncbi:uncharacterized mitochondrial protein AtMg00810-like [Aristolochia californica]|uniref:uncharacterized mitochondrial protein AtMg00810-like n=1 Tax=Aristolochia californica TaxID=171875 RepID=UPI0035E03E8F